MSYYPEPNNYVRDKVRVVLDLSNYATKKKLDRAKGVDTSDLPAKKIIALKVQVNITKLVNVLTSLNNLKTSR